MRNYDCNLLSELDSLDKSKNTLHLQEESLLPSQTVVAKDCGYSGTK